MNDVITLVGSSGEPVPIGTVVEYGGTLDHRHGKRVITAHEDPLDHPYRAVIGEEELLVAYTDGVAYVLHPVGMERSPENAREGISFVRRTSFRVVKEDV